MKMEYDMIHNEDGTWSISVGNNETAVKAMK